MADIQWFLRRSSIVLAAGLLLATAACSVQVDPSKDGKDKNVKVQTPFGNVQVKTNEMAASDVGLPAYPGATSITRREEKSGASDVQMAFGNWQMRLKVIKYHTPDSKDQVLTYYHKALGRYGDVVQCEGAKAVGAPAVTRQGLGCSEQDSGPHGSHSAVNADASALLKAGSKKHQHLVSIDKSGGDGTDFSLVLLDLPADEPPGKDEARESN
ncbi:MAG TPA: hypothetical protein VM554_09505 [Acidisarcina sp.]|nr:hypothetical protein [Acidisarcina sp.]